MRIKDKSLIKYFGKRNINEKTIVNELVLDSAFDMQELLSIMQAFPRKIRKIIIQSDDVTFIKNTVLKLPMDVNIELNSFSKKTFDELSLAVGVRVKKIKFDSMEKDCEAINIGDIMFKFPQADIDYPFQLNPKLNLTVLEDITEFLKRVPSVDASPEILEYYSDYIENNPPDAEKVEVGIGKGAIYNKKIFEEHNKYRRHIRYYPACDLVDLTDYSKYQEESKSNKIIFVASSMADVSLADAVKLKANEINCSIKIQSYDNGSHQNETYSLDEYIQMAVVMDELIGDIDESLPEEKKFGMIYERITKYLVYDYPAAYPKTDEEKKYAEENVSKCRNLRNGLLKGKAVCAGYADILKNACLIKGIECEYIQGPVDDLWNRDYYFYSKYVKENEDKELMYMDDKHAIVREYHAWNKVKLGDEWYNCDPTWDRKYIVDNKRPKYALLSDEIYKKLGRPTCEVLRHSCVNIDQLEKARMFSGFEPCEELIAYNKLIEFESTVDEKGNPRQLPIPVKEMPWSKALWRLKALIKGKFKVNFKELISNMKNKLRVADNRDTDILPAIDLDATDEFPRVDKKASWELSEEQLNAMKKAEQNDYVSDKDTKEDTEQEKEIGE